MFKRLTLAIVALAMTLTGVPLAANPAASQGEAAKTGRIRAVVVGVVNYRDPIKPMLGAYNDSVLIAETLIREGAKAEDVTLLTDAPEKALMDSYAVTPRLRQTKVTPDGLPTRANILGALKRIVDTTKPGDEVLMSFSGHGFQQNEAVAGSEPDGLDEVFLPYDTGSANGSEKIQNAILDDEIGAVIDAIRAKGGNVTYIADFCHSGDSNRDASGKDNGAPTSKELGLKVNPAKIFTVKDGNFVRDLAVETSKGKAGWGAYVGMLAVPSSLEAKQYQAPRYADPLEQAAHGLLTVYAMAAWNNPRVYSYRDLANRITAGVDGHKAPRPEFDGDLDRPVMGGLMKSAGTDQGGSWAVLKPRTAIKSTKDPVKIEQLEMSAGQLQGVVEGTVVGLALTTPEGDKTILYGRVSQADAYKAILVPTSYGDIAAEAWNDVKDVDGRPLSREVRLVATIEQQPVQLDYRIALPATPARPTAGQVAALAALKEIKPADIGATFVKAGQEADLILAFDRQRPDLLTLRQPPGRVTAAFGDIDLAQLVATGGANPAIKVRFTLGGALVKATRFARLQRVLASPAMASGTPGDDPAKDVKVEFYVGRPRALAAGASCPDTSADYYAVAPDAIRVGGDGTEAGGFSFQRCDWLFIKVTNGGAKDVYVNPLIFSPDGGILLFDGRDGRLGIKADNPTRLRAGESGVLQYSLSDAQQGEKLRDDFILLVSDVSDGVPLSYARLVQCPVVPGPDDGAACAAEAGPTLAGTRMRNNGAAGTGIEELIDAALVGSETRSGTGKKPTAVSALRYSWQTEAR